MSRLVLVLGDQLFHGLPGMPEDVPIFMREDFGFAQRSRYHKQKLVFVFSAMRHFAADRCNVIYQRLDSEDKRTYIQALNQTIEDRRIERLYMYEPANEFIEKQMIPNIACEVSLVRNPMFLTSRADWLAFRNSHRRLLMQDFYVERRKAMKILVDERSQPTGGQWSFDSENRKKLPSNVHPPMVRGQTLDAITLSAMAEVERYFPDHPGSVDTFAYPVHRGHALQALNEFIEDRFDRFGDYEDALSQAERTVFHSVLSPLLNFGLLTPDEVVRKALQADVPINSKEGFIRQILGWREFIFHLSREYDATNLPNVLGHHRRLAKCWYDGTTGLPPLDLAIRRVQHYAWCHHIERLMVIGSVMLMCEVNPGESYRWFMEMFIDSTDWVMLANVVGMSQFADGGFFATKPYISGSNYILKMSDFRRGEWCEIWDALYWRFIERHRKTFESNHRMLPMLRLHERMSEATKVQHRHVAEDFIQRVTRLD